MSVSVLTRDAYDPTTYEAVLVRPETVVCRDPRDDGEDAPAGDVRVVPVENLIHVDADHGDAVPGAAVDDDFYGGCEYAFLDFETYPEAEAPVS
jgi:hypothetical protein